MKTTIQVPDGLYRRVKAKSSLDGQTVCTVTQRLYELWLEGRVPLEDCALGSRDSARDWADRWVRETDELSEQIRQASADKRTGRNILRADRR